MTTSTYMTNRKQYQRPQGLLFANDSGTIVNNIAVPAGTEYEDFIILSDDSRQGISLTSERIEQRQRTINGTMRSYFIADKRKLSVSWENLPSRSVGTVHNEAGSLVYFNTDGTVRYPSEGFGENKTYLTPQQYRHTTDGGAGGVELQYWYQTHPGPFWVYIAYDNYRNFMEETDPYAYLGQYSDRVEMYFSEFSYEVKRRGGSTYDFWSVSFSLEEV